MRKTFSKTVERSRVRDRGFASRTGDRFGAFEIATPSGEILRVIASDGDEAIRWEHVSVSLSNRCPTWDEMAYVKRLFWEDEETVVQFHPKKSAYINHHPFTLHLWKECGVDHKLPPPIAV